MYINFWYPTVKSEDLTDTPQKVQILGQQFVVFRDSNGEAHCLSNVCTHRGGSLAGGKMRDDCVECPYHGWQFNGAGECVKIPSIGKEGKIPPRTKIDSYPVQEKYGIVFAFLGDLPEAERPAIYEIEEFGADGWRCNDVTILEVDYNYERSIENGLDPAHNEYVHPTHGFEGERDDYTMEVDAVQETPLGCGFWHIFTSPELKDETMNKVRNTVGDLEAGAWHYGPNVLITHIHMSAENWMHQYFFEAPVDETHTRIFFVNMRNCLLDPAHDAKITERNLVIAQQDIDVLVPLEPAITPSDMTHENMMPADKVIVRYRQWLKEWDAQGWRIDGQTVAANANRVAYAIPSPGRRTAKGWVIDPVPMATGSEEEALQAAE